MRVEAKPEVYREWKLDFGHLVGDGVHGSSGRRRLIHPQITSSTFRKALDRPFHRE
jgi:hypothetical protein